MSKEKKSTIVMSRRESTRRYWRRTDTPRSWWPWGLMPLLGLVVLFLFGALVTAPRIEAEVRTEVRDRFDTAGVFTPHVRGDGQGVNILAKAPASEAIYLKALAESTRCDTWAGRLTCPTSVSISLDQPKVTTEAAPNIAATGSVVPRVSMNAVSELDAREDGSMANALDVGSMNDRQKCDDEFGEIMKNETVGFRTGSATIEEGNEDLLNRLADLARTCPGNLVVEGHTDNQGDAEMNKALSVARAAAVRDALAELGIETDRMTAIGLGESMPVADNGTAAGRAKNRRIAITTEE